MVSGALRRPRGLYNPAVDIRKPLPAMQPPAQALAGIKDVLWKVYELEEVVRYGGGPEQQDQLEQRLQAMMSQIRDISSSASAFEDLRIPVDILRDLDDGGIPDLFTLETFKAALAENQASKGKVEAVKSLRSNLLELLSQKLPEETQEYKAMVDASLASKPEGS